MKNDIQKFIRDNNFTSIKEAWESFCEKTKHSPSYAGFRYHATKVWQTAEEKQASIVSLEPENSEQPAHIQLWQNNIREQIDRMKDEWGDSITASQQAYLQRLEQNVQNAPELLKGWKLQKRKTNRIDPILLAKKRRQQNKK